MCVLNCLYWRSQWPGEGILPENASGAVWSAEEPFLRWHSWVGSAGTVAGTRTGRVLPGSGRRRGREGRRVALWAGGAARGRWPFVCGWRPVPRALTVVCLMC